MQQVPDAVVEMLRRQRKTESRIVNGFAYLGLTLAVVGGLALVLGVPFLRANLIWATVVYAAVLIVGGRVLAGVLGGYYGDRIGYERARGRLLEGWAEWVVGAGGGLGQIRAERCPPAGVAENPRLFSGCVAVGARRPPTLPGPSRVRPNHNRREQG